MVIQQGDIFWIELDAPSGSAPEYLHPHVVTQNNVCNRSRINTVGKSQLSDKIGTLSARRVRDILNGIRLLAEPREPE